MQDALKVLCDLSPSCLVLEVGSESSCQRCETLITQNKAKYDGLQSFSNESADEQSKFCVGCGYLMVTVPNTPQNAFVSFLLLSLSVSFSIPCSFGFLFHCSICPSVRLNFISAALINIASSHSDTNLIRPKMQVGFWCQLRVLLKRHLIFMSRDMVSIHRTNA